jgi:colanic acid/amylovoran biosynthesis glycosyltransferase
MIKVLHLIESFLPVTENWIYPQVTRVPGVKTAVLCHELVNTAEFPLDNRPVFLKSGPIAEGNALVPRVVRGLARWSRANERFATAMAYLWRPSLLHAHFGTEGYAALGLKRLLGIPLITTFYGYDAWTLPRSEPVWVERFKELFGQGDVFLVEGPALRQRLVDIGCPIKKIKLRTLGVDVAEIAFKKKDFLPPLKVLMVGRFVEKKGLVDGLRACANAIKAGTALEVTIVGDSMGDPDAEQIKDVLRSIAQPTEISPHVNMTGFLPHHQVMSLLSQQDVLLCPSKHSGYGDAEGGAPFIISEAQAAGVLCVGTRHCDIPEQIIDGATGFLFGEGEVDQLTCILRKLSIRRDQLPALTLGARKLTEKDYNLSKQLDELTLIYREAVPVFRLRVGSAATMTIAVSTPLPIVIGPKTSAASDWRRE